MSCPMAAPGWERGFAWARNGCGQQPMLDDMPRGDAPCRSGLGSSVAAARPLRNPAWSRPGFELPISEPVQSLLRFGDTALKTSSTCSCTTCTFRFFARFRLVSLLLARLWNRFSDLNETCTQQKAFPNIGRLFRSDLYSSHAAQNSRHSATSYFGSWTGSVGCFGAFGGSTCRRRSSVPSSFFGFGPGLIALIILIFSHLQPRRLLSMDREQPTKVQDHR